MKSEPLIMKTNDPDEAKLKAKQKIPTHDIFRQKVNRIIPYNTNILTI